MIICLGLVIKSSIVLFNTVQAFFFFFAVPVPEDNLKAWIDNDGFKDSNKSDKTKSYLFDELALAKKEFIDFLDSNDKMSEITSNSGGARLVNQYIQAYMIRIKKLRMMIQFKVYFNTSKNAYGTEYLIAKSCWISNTNGKVIKKFSKVLGQPDLVKLNGKIPVQILDKVEKELESTMWNEYLMEYMPQQIEIKSI
jgi:hypothetical protein